MIIICFAYVYIYICISKLKEGRPLPIGETFQLLGPATANDLKILCNIL